jgi:predicted metal-dependent HD superfamily phosphohydrolase
MLSPERLESMQKDWVRLLERYNVAPVDAYPVFDLLVATYSAPERHYHNLEHLTEMFRVAGRLAPNTDDPAAIQFAIWFHDAVYDPRAKDNEVRSGELAVDLLGPLGVPTLTIVRVVRLVQATAHLTSTDPPDDRDTAALLDADLAILGAAEDRYRRYAADIRKEYAFVPAAEYCSGRAAVLKKFLARPRIFSHQIMFEAGEALARANIAAELKELDNSEVR